MKKNILFFAQQIHEPWIEWVKNNSIKICEWLNKKIDVNIISHKWPYNNKKHDKINWVNVFYLLQLDNNKIFQLFYLILWWFKSLFFVLKTKPEKIFIQYLDTSYIFPLLLIRLIKPNTKIIITLYSTDELDIWYKKIFLKYFKFSKLIIISDYLSKWLLKLWIEKSKIISIPLSYDKNRYLSYSNPIKRKKKTILFSAGPIKEAWSFFMVDLAKKMPDYNFIFALRKFNKKSEDEVNLLNKYMKNSHVTNIEILRNIDNMEEVLWNVSALVLPLQDINIKMLIPVALLEAMWRWIICFVSDLPNLELLIKNDVNWIIFNKESTDDLKEKIIKNIDKNKIWMKAFEFAKKYPSFDEIIEKYYKLI